MNFNIEVHIEPTNKKDKVASYSITDYDLEKYEVIERVAKLLRFLEETTHETLDTN